MAILKDVFGTPLDLPTLQAWVEIARGVSIVFVVFAVVSAILLQAAHELFRTTVNRWIVTRWLGRRPVPLSLTAFLSEVHSQPNALFSLPYWQLTGQVNAALSAQLNLYPSSKLVSSLGNIDQNYVPEIESILTSRGVEGKREAVILRDVASRAQAGVDSLHAELRSYWTTFDYFVGFVVVALVTTLMTTLETAPGQRRVLYAIMIFSWLATPLVRRTLERLVPFK